MIVPASSTELLRGRDWFSDERHLAADVGKRSHVAEVVTRITEWVRR